MTKNRNREPYSFANINLLGRCNIDCFFCLGKDLDYKGQNQSQTHYKDWKQFNNFLSQCRTEGIRRLYITGQNMDSLQYKYLGQLVAELQYLQRFQVGLRTNGYLAWKNLTVINQCELSTGYTIHSFVPETVQKITGTSMVPDWDKILDLTLRPRVSIVVNRHNMEEVFWIIRWLAPKHKHIRYVQLRKVSTDTRQEELAEDQAAFEEVYRRARSWWTQRGTRWGAPEFWIEGLPVTFWRTVATSVNSMNYFTDGTISGKYFIVEGYLDKHPKIC